MGDNGWSPPPPPAYRLDADSALRSIRQQHERIRTLLQDTCAAASAVLESNAPMAGLTATIAELRRTMKGHLDFEEGVLLPILEDDLPLGPERAAHLRDEHVRQRGLMDALYDEARRHPSLPILAVKLASLATALLADMDEEEDGLLTRDVVRDDQIVIDQTCG